MYLWESYEELITNGSYIISGSAIDEYSPRFIRIYRNEKKKLLLEIELEIEPGRQRQFNLPDIGRIIGNNEYKSFILTSHQANEIILEKCYLVKSYCEPGKKLVETYSINILSGESIEDDKHYTFEWVENIDSNNWPQVPPVARNNSCAEIISKLSASHNYLFVEGLCIEFNNVNIYLCSLRRNNDNTTDNKACLIYKDSLSETERDKIRDCISFLLGRKLVYLGCSSFNHELELVNYKSISPYGFNRIFYDLPTQPPVKLTDFEGGWGGFSDNKASLFIEKIYNNYDKYDFSHIFWIYWDALCLKSINSSILFSSAIEAVQRAYINSKKKKNGAIIGKEKWANIKNKLINILNTEDISENDRKTLTNKINNLNQLPQSLVTMNFFEEIGVLFGDQEKEAYKHRNKVTHGAKLKASDAKEYQIILNRDKTLRMILVRIILSITDAYESYIDYSSINHPTKNLHE